MASKGNPKPKLRDLSLRHPTEDEKAELHKAFFEGAPMVTVMLGQAMVEIELDGLLRQRLKRRDDDTWQSLVDDRGPLGTFSEKIVLGYALGIYDDHTKDRLDRIRRVRNAFAHSKTLLNFDNKLIDDEIRGLKLPASRRSRRYDEIQSIKSPMTSSRDAYLALCYLTYEDLLLKEIRSHKAKHAHMRRKLQELEQRNPFVTSLLGGLHTLSGLGLGQYAPRNHMPDPTGATLGGLLGIFPSLLSGDPAEADEPEEP